MNEKPYYALDQYLKETFGEKIYKIALDAGMTCPNRDGKLGTRGCIFCSEGGSGDFAAKQSPSISEQLSQGLSYFKDKKVGNRFIAYFQSYTNTYAPVETLQRIFKSALDESHIVGISIATRPDCLSSDVLQLLQNLKTAYPDKFIWIELGLQTIHPKTATYIRRGYPLAVFEKAVSDLKAIGIPVITHVIIGLPGESKDMILETCKYLNTLSISGIKLQLLHILEHTDLADDYRKGLFQVLSLESYLDILISCLEVLSPDIIIHRVTGDGPKNILIAPQWSCNKRNVLNSLHKEMKKRNTWQGRLYHDTGSINSI